MYNVLITTIVRQRCIHVLIIIPVHLLVCKMILHNNNYIGIRLHVINNIIPQCMLFYNPSYIILQSVMEGHSISPTPHPRQPLTPSTTITPSGKKPTSIRPLTAAYQAAASQHQVRFISSMFDQVVILDLHLTIQRSSVSLIPHPAPSPLSEN